jgi:peptidoglycan hydrolase CwlO-like protein
MSGTLTSHATKAVLRDQFPEVEFHSEIEHLLSEILEMSGSIDEMDAEVKVQAYETVVERTARILAWINKNTRLKTHSDASVIEALLDEKAELEERWRKLLDKAADLKRENRELREKASKSNTGVRELAALLLGVSADAPESAVKAAYREKVKKAHPDAGGDPDFFKAVTEAMLVLIKGKR